MDRSNRTISRRRWIVGGTVFAVLAVGAVASAAIATAGGTAVTAGAQEARSGEPGTPELLLPSVAPLAERLSPTVVSINVIQRMRLGAGGGMPLPFQFFFGPPGQQGTQPMPEFENRGSGSGVIVDADGLILTNAHVVEDASEVTVQVSTGESYAAEVVGSDEPTDLALLRIHADGALPAATLGDSDAVAVGDWVVAIGNPFGLEHTVTLGIVSAKERRVGEMAGSNGYANFIQTDASINPGNSGGPLFDLAGEVVGINTAINAAGQGIGFAIPSNMAKAVVDQLRETGRVVRSWIGVSIQSVTPELAESFGLTGRPRGALVAQVTEGSPGDRAGLRPGDIVLRFGDDDIGDAAELPWLASIAGVGREVRLQVWRDGAKRDASLTLDAMPDEQNAHTVRSEVVQEEETESGGLGLRVEDVPSQLRGRLDLPEGGAMVSEVDPQGAAADHGIRPGDVILEVDGASIADAEALAAATRDHAKDDVLRLLVRSREGTRFVGVRLR